MRRRLVLSTLTAVLLAVFLLGVPLAIAGDLLLIDQSKHEVQQRARSMALSVDHLLAAGEPIDAATPDRGARRFAEGAPARRDGSRARPRLGGRPGPQRTGVRR